MPTAPLLAALALPLLASQEGADLAGSPAPDGRLPRIAEGRAIVDAGVSALELEAHVGYLAQDALAGRDTGSEGERLAALYLAAELERAGFAPGGDDGGFLQRVPVGRERLAEPPTLALIPPDGDPVVAEWGVDFDLSRTAAAAGRFDLARADAPGAVADARGALFYDGPSRGRRDLADGWDVVLTEGSSRPGRPRELADERAPRLSLAARRAPWAELRVRGPLLDRLRAGEFTAVEVGVEVAWEPSDAFNVVGVLRGEGELAGEAVVLSAHLDHIGTRDAAPEREDAEGEEALEDAEDAEPGPPDLVYNGADDDASGCAAVLEVAEALAQGPAPARTVVALLATGEERGLLGTYHYLDAPVVPLDRTVANVNFEMVGRPDANAGGPGKLWLTGYERSNLGPAWAEAGLALVPDPYPEQHFFQRSDNYAFARLGIVAQTLSSYDLHDDYHTVGDEWWTLDYAHMAAAIEDSAAAVRLLVEGALTPEWAPDGNPAE